MPREVVVVVPGRLDTRTGGSIYDRRMIDGLRDAGWQVQAREVSDRFPFPTAAAMAEVASLFAAIPNGRTVLVDGLVFSAIPEIAARESGRLRLVALVHLPLAADLTRDRDALRALEQVERRALHSASAIVATGKATVSLLARYTLKNVIVVEPGTDRAPLALGSVDERTELLTVATVHSGKGHEILVTALASLPHRNWHLTCAGSLTRDPDAADRLHATIRRSSLESFVLLAGELNDADLSACYNRADVFVLPTLQETYGMAVAEALAHGLPVISTMTGAIPDLVGPDAGLLVAPGDRPALAAALSRVLGNEGPALRARLANGARLVRQRLRTWDDAARDMAAALSRIDANG